MKRILPFLAALMILCCVTAAAENPRTGMDLSYERIVWMAQYMRDLVYGDYLSLKQVPDSMQSVAREWAAGVNESPRMVLELNINQLSFVVEQRAIFSQEHPMVGYEAESSVIVAIWQGLAYAAAQENALAESSYEEIMQVNSVINAFQMYAEDGAEGNAMFMVLYDNAAPILLMVNSENGAVSIQGMFLPSAKLAKCTNYGQVSLWTMMNGLPITCQEVKPE